MSKKTIVITGAGTGIGKDTAFALAKRGHTVIATTETDRQAELLNEEAIRKGITLQVSRLDITSPADRAKIELYDPQVLINNAGIGESGSLAEIDIDKVRENFEVNVFSALSFTQLALKKMIAKKSGTIVFISSLASKAPMSFLAPYSMTKAALSNGVTALRSELKYLRGNVHIVLIEPGAYHTGFNQRNMAKKYAWMNEDSYFYSSIGKLRLREAAFSRFAEMRSTASIVRQIATAAESENPRARYAAPWWHSAGVYLMQVFGR